MYDEMRENIAEARVMDQRLRELENRLREVDFSNYKATTEYMVDIHLLITDYKWELMQLYDEMYLKMMKSPLIQNHCDEED